MANIIDDNELDAMFKKFEAFENEHKLEVVKYFDRIHDKLLAYQLFFLAGYISLVALENISLSPWWLLLPVGCICRLIYIDYAMMNRSRLLSQFTSLSKEKREKAMADMVNINKISLEVILETITLTAFFLYFAIYQF